MMETERDRASERERAERCSALSVQRKSERECVCACESVCVRVFPFVLSVHVSLTQMHADTSCDT